MALGHPHPTDVLVDDLIGLYAANVARLEGIVRDGLRRGLNPERWGTEEQERGDATLAYRARALAQARAILGELERQAGTVAPIAVGLGYRAGILATDRTLTATGAGRGGLTTDFGRVHVRAVEELAGQLHDSLTAAARRAGQNVEDVFARAAILEGALPGDGIVNGVRFLGRRADDPWRRVALEVQAGGIIGLDTRRQTSAMLKRRLLEEGVTDAVTGFVDRRGRRWSLDSYAAMAVRTTTREATTAGTANRLRDHGLDLVTVSTHKHPADECTPFEGNTYSLTGDHPTYPALKVRPPFHPNCAHVLTPAEANLDEFERELGLVADELVEPPPVPDPPAVPAPGPEATTPAPAKPKRQSPEEKIAERAETVRREAGERGRNTAAAELAEIAAADNAQRSRIVHALMHPNATGRLDSELDLQADHLTDEDRELIARLRAAKTVQRAVEYDETETTAIGREVRRLVDRRVKAAHKAYLKRDAELKAADEAAWDAAVERAGGSQSKALDDQEAEDEQRRIRALRRDLYREHVANERRILVDVLGKVRAGFGTEELRPAEIGKLHAERLDYVPLDVDRNTRGYLREDFAEVSGLIPAEWAQGAGGFKVAHTTTRAFYMHGVDGSKAFMAVGSSTPRTVLHELGHRFERTVPGALSLEAQFYDRRTRRRNGLREDPVPMGGAYGAEELTREDKWRNRYMGKAYRRNGGPTDSQPAVAGAFELLSMGLEHLFYGEPDGLDEDYREWLLGVLTVA